MKTSSTESSFSTYLVGNRRKRGVIGRQKTFIGMCLSVWTNIDFPIRGKISFHLWKCHWDLLRGEKTFHRERQVKLALIPFTSSSAGKTEMKFRRPVNTPCDCSFLHNLLPWEYPVLGPPGPVLRIHRGLGKSDRKTPAYFSNHSTRYPFICMIVTFSSTRMWAPPGLGLCFLTIPAGTNPSWGRLSVNICALERKRWSFRDVKRRKWEPKGEMPFSARDRVEGGWARKEGGDDGGSSREGPGRLLSAEQSGENQEHIADVKPGRRMARRRWASRVWEHRGSFPAVRSPLGNGGAGTGQVERPASRSHLIPRWAPPSFSVISVEYDGWKRVNTKLLITMNTKEKQLFTLGRKLRPIFITNNECVSTDGRLGLRVRPKEYSKCTRQM